MVDFMVFYKYLLYMTGSISLRRLSGLKLQPLLILFITIALAFTFLSGCDAESSGDDGAQTDTSGDGNDDGAEDELSVDDIQLSWSTWGPNGQPLPDRIVCTVSGGTATSVTIAMAGDGLDPIEYTLRNDGTGGDDLADDELYSIQFTQDLDVNALWAVDNNGFYLSCQASNATSSDEMTYLTAGELTVENESGTSFDLLNVARATDSDWGTDFIPGALPDGQSFTVTDVPCGVFDLRVCDGGTCLTNEDIIMPCNGTFTWTIVP